MLKNYKGHKTVYIDGLAASIASIIALAGDKVIMRTGSSYMIHKPMFGIRSMLNATELRKLATDLDSIESCILQVYKEHLKDGIELAKIEEMVNEETWMSSDEASKFFNFEVETSLEAVACTSDYLEKFTNIEKYKIENKKQEQELFNLEFEILKLEE